jgi:hypothetical protein
MRISAPLSLLAFTLLVGCAIPTGPVEVTRFNRVAEGQAYGQGSFAIVPKPQNPPNPQNQQAGSQESQSALSQSPYNAAVSREMARFGYVIPADEAKSDLLVEVYTSANSVAPGQSRGPVSVGVGGGTGGYRSGVGLGVGLDITSLLNKPKARVLTELSVRILSRSSGAVIWEGKAVQEANAGSPAAQASIAAAKLAESLFKGFPGKSGETIIIK